MSQAAKERQFWGLSRELIAAGGGALVTFGIVHEQAATSIVGAIMAVVALGVAIATKAPSAGVATTLRKTLSSVGAMIVTLGILEPQHAEALLAIVMPAAAMWWSYRSNGKPLPWPDDYEWDEPD